MVPPDYHWEKVQRILEGDDMTDKDVIQALRCCADGEYKDCAMHEDKQRCQENLLDKAADLIERLTAENADLRKEIEWKDMVVALAQKEQAGAEAERDAAIADMKISSGCTSCKYHCSDTIFCRDCNKKQNCKCMSCGLGLPNWEWHGLPEAPEEG